MPPPDIPTFYITVSEDLLVPAQITPKDGYIDLKILPRVILHNV